MAFSFGFGASQPATSAGFGFAAASQSGFGAPSIATAFGTPGASLFGAASSAAASTPSLFGTSPFGAASSAATPSASPFGTLPASPMFGAPAQTAAATTTNPFGTPTAGTQPSTLSFFGQPQQQQQQLRAPLTYRTKFEELGPQEQQVLNSIQQQVSAARDDCRVLDADARLHDTAALRKTMNSETNVLKQSLESLIGSISREDEALHSFRERAMSLLRSTESVTRLFQRCKMWRELPQPGSSGAPVVIPQVVQEALSQPVVLPNPYLEEAVASFQQALEEYHACIGELERALPSSTSALLLGDETSAVAALPTIVTYMHDYFVHVAARLEALHSEVSKAKSAVLARRRAQGDYSDPFEEARRLHAASASPSHVKTLPPYNPAGAGQAVSGTGVGTPAAAVPPQAGLLALPAPVANTTQPPGFGTPTANPFGFSMTPGMGAFGTPVVAGTDANRSANRSGSRKR